MASSQVKLYIELAPEQEIRRFNLEPKATYESLRQRVESLVGHSNFKVLWQDSEKDFVVLGSADELAAAKDVISNNLLRLFIRPTGSGKGATGEDKEKKIHRMVTCDGCQGIVSGTRYKCMECPDYDLCESCEAKGVHQDHDVLAIRRPRSSEWKKIFAQGYGSRGAISPRHPCHRGGPGAGECGPRHGSGAGPCGPCGPRGGAGPFRGGPFSARGAFPGGVPPSMRPFMRQHLGGDQTVEMDFDLNRPVAEIISDVTKKVLEAINKAEEDQQASNAKVPQSGQPEVETEQSKRDVGSKAEQEIFQEAVVAAVNAVAETVTVVGDAVNTFVEELSKAESEHEWTHLEAESVEEKNSKAGNVDSNQSEESQPEVEKNAKDQRIEAALRAMEEMGFSGEGTILRRLLENYSGDIGRVLDSIK